MDVPKIQNENKRLMITSTIFMEVSLNLPKNQRKYLRISALASKNRSNQKDKYALYHLLDDFILTLLLYYIFDFTSFLSFGQKSFKINFVGFLVDLKTPKGRFEINWPLISLKNMSSLTFHGYAFHFFFTQSLER